MHSLQILQDVVKKGCAIKFPFAVNRRIELHGKSFTISPAVSRPVLKVKDAKTKP